MLLTMLLIMFRFLWKNHFLSIMYMSHFLCIIWHWHMLRYAGNRWAIGAWRAPMWGCCRPTSSPSPGTCMFYFLWKHHFFIRVVYMSKIIFIIWIWHMLFYAGFYWGTGAWRAPDWWPTHDEPVGTFMYRFLLILILMIQHVLF